MKDAYKKFGMLCGVLIVIIAFSLLIAFPIKWLWNGVMPDMFGLPEITFWKAYGMYLLFHLLLRGVTINEK
jgi:hypothetical protein